MDDIHRNTSDWLRHGVAALAVSVLGLGVAGSIMLTGAAQETSGNPASTGSVQSTRVVAGPRPVGGTQPVGKAPVRSAEPDVGKSSEFTSREDQASRSGSRGSLSAAQVAELAKKRADELTKAEADTDEVAQEKASAERDKDLSAEASASTKNARRIKADADAAAAAAKAARERSTPESAPDPPGRTTEDETTEPRGTTEQDRTAAATEQDGTAAATEQDSPAAATETTTTPPSGRGDGKASSPITSGYTIAARFGQVGSWSRYHTGLDFAAPVGTPIHAPTNGTVTNAGSGSASGWAGNYVTVKHSDGTTTLFAHMSTVSVSVGQSVSGGQVLGAVGMTGRTFGPHVHFEVYPAGVTPGDVYRAVNPESWLAALGLHP